jgi:mannose-6-phosphate isomerase-like protein (cupin superfamily)
MSTAPAKVNIAEALAGIDDHWNPRIAAEINGTHVKLVKFAGAFDWHSHAEEDELFLVIAGTLRMKLRSGDIDVGPGEFITIPHGTEHCPEAIGGECAVMLIEPASTINTGDVVTAKTRTELQRL